MNVVMLADCAENFAENFVCTLCELISRARLPAAHHQGVLRHRCICPHFLLRMIVSCNVAFTEPEVLSPVQESKTNEDLSHEVSLLVGSAKTWQPPITSVKFL